MPSACLNTNTNVSTHWKQTNRTVPLVYVTYNYKDKEAAKKKYEEAFGKQDMTDE